MPLKAIIKHDFGLKEKSYLVKIILLYVLWKDQFKSDNISTISSYNLQYLKYIGSYFFYFSYRFNTNCCCISIGLFRFIAWLDLLDIKLYIYNKHNDGQTVYGDNIRSFLATINGPLNNRRYFAIRSEPLFSPPTGSPPNHRLAERLLVFFTDIHEVISFRQ